MIHRLLVLGVFVCLLAAPPLVAQKTEPKKEDMPKIEAPPDTTPDDLRLLKEVGLGSDGPAMLEYFRKRTFPEANPEEMAALIEKLGDEDFGTRERAYDRLLVLGAGALVGIKEAEKAKDAEVSRRAFELKQRIEAKAEPAIQSATARLLAKLKPAGAADVLMAYLPYAADQTVTDDLCQALGSLAYKGKEVEPVLVKSLEDKLPIKRGAAAEALARAKVQELLPVVKELLKDPEPSVRLRVGLALVPYKEKEVLPVLIEALGHLNPEQLWPVEEILVRLAGENAPQVSLGANDAARTTCRDAWQKWFDANGKTIDLAKLEQPQVMLGYTLVVMQNVNRLVGGARQPAIGQVVELDANKKPRWKFDVPTYPVDAQITGPDRVLIAEYQGGKVSERDFKGTEVWSKLVGGNPIGVQRLVGGNTFVVMQNRLVEYDRKGEEAWSMQRPNHDIFRAKKLRNGEIVFVTNNGALTRMEAKTQKVIKNFQVGQIPVLFGSIDILTNGNVLVPDFQRSRVVEYDNDGKEVFSFNVQWPNSVMRLPNGNTLVASQNSRTIAEFDAQGKSRWTHQLEGMPFNAKRR
ncbi:MAG: PQQ-binding-like beta-propeller repeat protein [Gemmataceae bacterium]|nr:PQQ-binding-like beta-propeller repeat protein [Gemmataceae bacterium]